MFTVVKSIQEKRRIEYVGRSRFTSRREMLEPVKGKEPRVQVVG